MPYFKSKADVICVVVSGICFLVYCYLYTCFPFWIWLCAAPVYAFLSLGLSVVVAGGKIDTKSVDRGIRFKTTVINMAEDLVPCTLVLLEDRLLVTSPHKGSSAERQETFRAAFKGRYQIPFGHQIDAQVPLWKITKLLLEDKSKDGHGMAGLGVDFEDEEGEGRLMFFTHRGGAKKQTERFLGQIQAAQSRLTRGLNLEPTEVIDLSAIRKYVGSQVIHRDLGRKRT